MAYGVTIRNGSGEIIIDQNFQNYMIRDAGTTVIIGQQNGQFTTYYHEARLTTLGAVDPMLFVQVGGSITTGVLGVTRSSNGQVTRIRFASRASSGLRFFTAGPEVSTTVEEPYGLVVWDSAGRIVFDSGRRVPKLIDIQVFNHPTDVTEIVNVPHADQPNAYYFLGGLNGWRLTFTDVPFHAVTGYFMTAIRQVSDSVAEVSMTILGDYGALGDGAWPTRNMVFVAAPST